MMFKYFMSNNPNVFMMFLFFFYTVYEKHTVFRIGGVKNRNTILKAEYVFFFFFAVCRLVIYIAYGKIHRPLKGSVLFMDVIKHKQHTPIIRAMHNPMGVCFPKG